MKARPALLSLALHAALLALLLLRFVPLWWHGRPQPPTRIAMIELVQQNSPVVDNHPPVAARPPSPKPPPPKPSVKPPPPPPAPPAPQASLPPPPLPAPPPPKPTPPAPQSPAPAPPTPTPPAPEAAAPEIRLGDMGDIGSGLVSGPAVIPARPDSTVHNAPPAYPVAAARRGEFGTVVLVVHIAPDGHASGVDVADSSGHDELDRAAREAVAKWQFRPAENNGLAVASSMVIDIHFNLTGKAR